VPLCNLSTGGQSRTPYTGVKPQMATLSKMLPQSCMASSFALANGLVRRTPVILSHCRRLHEIPFPSARSLWILRRQRNPRLSPVDPHPPYLLRPVVAISRVPIQPLLILQGSDVKLQHHCNCSRNRHPVHLRRKNSAASQKRTNYGTNADLLRLTRMKMLVRRSMNLLNEPIGPIPKLPLLEGSVVRPRWSTYGLGRVSAPIASMTRSHHG
jgi:hypothetical protein